MLRGGEEIIGPVSEGCRLHGVGIRTHTAVSSTRVGKNLGLEAVFAFMKQ